MDHVSTDLDSLLAAWHTNNRVTIYLVNNLPPDLWAMEIPGTRRRTVRSLAAHMHNARCMWIKMIGAAHGVVVPNSVDLKAVRQRELSRALSKSGKGIAALIELGVTRGGHVPPATWQNFPTDVVHLLNYFVAHEAHHRGQLVLIARQLGYKLPNEVTGGLWQWKKRAKE